MNEFTTEMLVFIGGVLIAGFRSYLGKLLIELIIRTLKSVITWTEQDVKLYHEFLEIQHAKRAKKS